MSSVAERRSRKRVEQRIRNRPMIWKYNDDVYVNQCSDSKTGFSIVQKSNNMALIKDSWSFGFNMSKGYYHANSHQRKVNHGMGAFHLIGVK
jgi:hypothetical protein